MIKKIIGKSKVTNVLPLLQRVADENGLRLNRASEFKKARTILEDRYVINRWV